MEIPTVSVDRAVLSHVQDVNISYEALADYYGDLPFDHKPSLTDCHIHFSAVAPRVGNRVTMGAHIFDPVDSEHYDPQAPPANIMLFVGSFAAKNTLPDINKALKHELVHYADPSTEVHKMSQKEREAHAELMLRTGIIPKVFFLGKAAASTGLIKLVAAVGEVDVSWGAAASVAAGVTAIRSLMKSGKNRRRINELERQVYDMYGKRPAEVTAHKHVNSDHQIVTVTPCPEETMILHRQKGRSNPLTDKAHRILSLKAKPYIGS